MFKITIKLTPVERPMWPSVERTGTDMWPPVERTGTDMWPPVERSGKVCKWDSIPAEGGAAGGSCRRKNTEHFARWRHPAAVAAQPSLVLLKQGLATQTCKPLTVVSAALARQNGHAKSALYLLQHGPSGSEVDGSSPTTAARRTATASMPTATATGGAGAPRGAADPIDRLSRAVTAPAAPAVARARAPASRAPLPRPATSTPRSVERARTQRATVAAPARPVHTVREQAQQVVHSSGATGSLRARQQRCRATLPCGQSCSSTCHVGPHERCHESCPKALECGHPCERECGLPCASPSECGSCIARQAAREQARRELRQGEIEAARRAAVAQAEELERRGAEESGAGFRLEELETTDSHFTDIAELVAASIQPAHGVHLRVTKVSRVDNAALKARWLRAQSRLVDPSAPTSRKFHGTSREAAKQIVKGGFKLPPSKKRLMYGRGVYFATNSTKSARDIYTRGGNTLLLCDVCLGAQKKVMQANDRLYDEWSQDHTFDSVFVPRGSAMQNDEFVVFDPDLALPAFVIEYQKLELGAPRPPRAIAGGAGGAPAWKPHRVIQRPDTVDDGSEDDKLFLIVEAQFNRTQKSKGFRVARLEVFDVPKFRAQFDEKRAQLKREGCSKDELKTRLMFHGTPEANMKKICQTGFIVGGRGINVANGTALGFGVYTGIDPDKSLGYSRDSRKLLMVEAIPGKRSPAPQQDGVEPGGHNYARGSALVLFSPEQVLPRYIIHLEELRR